MLTSFTKKKKKKRIIKNFKYPQKKKKELNQE